MDERVFHILTPEELKKGAGTDVYFLRTIQILERKGIKRRVAGEVRAHTFPKNWKWVVMTGIHESLKMLEGLKVNVRAVKEGTLVNANEPVLEIDGEYSEFGAYETSILGFLCQATGIATASARCTKAAGGRPVLSFGSRRIHPAIMPMVDRSAYIGGCSGVSSIKGAEIISEEPSGTMPHALILIMGDTVEATKLFDEIIDKKVARVSLVDTFHDEKFESIKVAEALGDHLYAVRLDTPRSRRGDFLRILEEVRWELDSRGFEKVKLFVSGGIDEEAILHLNPLVDSYGVGTSISGAPVIDFSFDIVDIEGKAIAKKGKESGRKNLFRCHKCFRHTVVVKEMEQVLCRCGNRMENLLVPVMHKGSILGPLPDAQELREYVLTQLNHFEL